MAEVKITHPVTKQSAVVNEISVPVWLAQGWKVAPKETAKGEKSARVNSKGKR